MLTRLILLIVFLSFLGMITLPATDSPWSTGNDGAAVFSVSGTSSENSAASDSLEQVDVTAVDRWSIILRFSTSIRDGFYLLGEFIIKFLSDAWTVTPLRFRPLFGIMFLIISVLSILGAIHIKWTRGISRKLTS